MARPRNKVSIYTLSEELGLSPATVSKALRDYPQISESTRQRVREAAKQKQFTPTSVSRERINICTLIQRDPGAPINFKPFVASVLEGIAKYTWTHDLESSFFGGDYKELNKMNLVRELYKRQVDGAIIVNADSHSRFISKMVDQSFPYACLVTTDQEENRNIIGVDEHSLAYKAADYLLQLGHQRILVLVSNAEGRTGRERLAGFKSAMEDRKVPVDPQLIIEPKDLTLGGLGSGFSLTGLAMHKHPDITAIYTMDQNMALGASRALLSAGFRIPEDVSIICCDDCEYHEYSSPSISAVSIPTEMLAFQAARMVHQQIVDSLPEHAEETSRTLQPKLIVRESTGPARS